MTDDLFPHKRLTPQQQGRKNERKLAKRYGAREHPNSGAGRIKDDASSDDAVFEFKKANKSHTVKLDDLKAIHRRAHREGKEPFYVIEFADGVVLEGVVRMT